jgi:hypothetical protein
VFLDVGVGLDMSDRSALVDHCLRQLVQDVLDGPGRVLAQRTGLAGKASQPGTVIIRNTSDIGRPVRTEPSLNRP